MTCISHVQRQLDMVSYSLLGGNGVPLRGAMLFRLRFLTITAALSIPFFVREKMLCTRFTKLEKQGNFSWILGIIVFRSKWFRVVVVLLLFAAFPDLCPYCFCFCFCCSAFASSLRVTTTSTTTTTTRTAATGRWTTGCCTKTLPPCESLSLQPLHQSRCCSLQLASS